jgi:hypothetical protein
MLRSYAVWAAKRLGLNVFLEGMESDGSKEVQRELLLEVKQNEKTKVWNLNQSQTKQ